MDRAFEAFTSDRGFELADRETLLLVVRDATALILRRADERSILVEPHASSVVGRRRQDVAIMSGVAEYHQSQGRQNAGCVSREERTSSCLACLAEWGR